MAIENIFPQPHKLCMDYAHALNPMKERALSLSEFEEIRQIILLPLQIVLRLKKGKIYNIQSEWIVPSAIPIVDNFV